MNTILTNPEMLHGTMLPNHGQWRTFFRNLRCYEEVFVISSEMLAKARRSAIARAVVGGLLGKGAVCLLYTSPSPRD